MYATSIWMGAPHETTICGAHNTWVHPPHRMSELFRLYPDAVRDSHAAAYSLLVVAPLTLLASNLLLYRGKKTTRLQVYLVSLVVPLLAVGLPLVHTRVERSYWLIRSRRTFHTSCWWLFLQWYLPSETNVYRMLTVRDSWISTGFAPIIEVSGCFLYQ